MALEAYSAQEILSFFNKNKKEGLTEHGFSRLTANIGILIANNRRKELMPLFLEMMDFCCSQIPTHKAANDFSVREILCCILELEANKTVEQDRINGWKKQLTDIDVNTVYNVFAKTPDDAVANWAVYTAASEWMRHYCGLNDTKDFVSLQFDAQLKAFDENGMYKDPCCPMVYDTVTRGLFSFMIYFGYNGANADRMDKMLRNAARMSMKMISVNGEFPFGGRSNQFLFNEALFPIIGEYEACRYHREGNDEMAGQFRSLVDASLDHMEKRLSVKPMSHIKNRYPIETKYGCEDYGYFRKYMITVASMLYVACMMHDETIKPVPRDMTPYVTQTSDDFHKVFMQAGGYFAEWDTCADTHYDTGGLGRLHIKDAPSCICLSLDGAAESNFVVDIDPSVPFAITAGIKENGRTLYAGSPEDKYECVEKKSDATSAFVRFRITVKNGKMLYEDAYLNADGMTLKITGDEADTVAVQLPAFDFDGETHTDIRSDEKSVAVSCQSYVCRYETDGKIIDTGLIGANKNGHYRLFEAIRKNQITVTITIGKENE